MPNKIQTVLAKVPEGIQFAIFKHAQALVSALNNDKAKLGDEIIDKIKVHSLTFDSHVASIIVEVKPITEKFGLDNEYIVEFKFEGSYRFEALANKLITESISKILKSGDYSFNWNRLKLNTDGIKIYKVEG